MKSISQYDVAPRTAHQGHRRNQKLPVATSHSHLVQGVTNAKCNTPIRIGGVEISPRETLLRTVNDPPPDELTILGEVKVTLNNATSKTPRRHEAPECKPDDVPKRPFKNSKFSDVTTSVDGRETQAHKRTPAEQNRAFPAMLETNMTEKRTSNVNIKDMNHETIVL
ncbi:hypothetical protein DBV15_07037 [Temnothorax longispinosus]|uniref:BTB domain-containing protein n=1 Tax=Temnothorax longispinosus TaxID=300112 RepID=A0A4S2JE22_9HYME|nr:hypothetical protein DBV15_07037 [Temnothorax longispinosus]